MASSSSSLPLEVEHPWLDAKHPPFAGKYTVERIIGRGGMGVVFEARHTRLGQHVAIKVLGSELRQHPALVERFEREARACGALSSAHAVRVFDIDATEDGTPYIVMELLAGCDLSTVIERDGPQPVARAVGWILEACDAIAEAHRVGIIHRDIKPSNLFLSEVDGCKSVKVLDFGIAKHVSTNELAITQALAPLGTPQYMSPEQVRCAKDVDVRTDVWSLGVTLYELVCGHPPFDQESLSACIAAIVTDEVPDPRRVIPGLSNAFVAVLMRALEKNVEDRFPNIAALVAALVPFADEAGKEHVRSMRLAPDSGSFIAVLPPVSLVRSPLERTRESRVGLIGAVVLGIAALVLTERWAANIADAPPSGANAARMSAPAEAPVMQALDVLPAAAPPPLVLVAPSVVESTPPAREVRARTTKPTPSTVASRSSIHGGLSSPGF